MKQVTILMTGTGAPGAPSIIKCLRNNNERDVRIIGVDMNEKASSRRLVDAFYVVPSAKDPSFIDCILTVCRKEGVTIVLPLVTRELEVFSSNLELFLNNNLKVSVMDSDVLHTANNKGLLLDTLKKNNIPVPFYRIANTVDELENDLTLLGYPNRTLVVKPCFGNGSRGTRFIDDKESRFERFFEMKPDSYWISKNELMSILRERKTIPQMMVMEFLPGIEYSVDILADHGKVVYCVCRKGLKVVSSIMMESVIEKNKSVEDLCELVVNCLGLDGNVGFDLKEREDGTPCLMEINPRLTAGVVACAVAGVNLPYLRIKQLLGEELPNCRPKYGFSMQRRNAEVFFDSDGFEINW